MSEIATPEAGPLTQDAAIELLTAKAEPVADPAPEVAAAEATEEPQGDDQSPEEADLEAENLAEGDETEADEAPVVAADAPTYWSTDAKAEFARLPPEMQAVVLAQEGPREEATAKAKAEAARQVAMAQTEMQKTTRLAEELGEFLPQAIQTFANRWGADPDWEAYLAENGAEAAFIAKTRYDTELAQLQKLSVSKQHAEALAFDTFVRAEFEALKVMAPDLADPVTGGAKMAEVTSYLRTGGYDDDTLRQISARDMTIARKAMLYDKAEAARAARPAPRPIAPAPKAVVRPAAGQAQSSTERTAAQIANRYAQTRSIDDAVAMLLAGKA